MFRFMLDGEMEKGKYEFILREHVSSLCSWWREIGSSEENNLTWFVGCIYVLEWHL